MGGKEAERQIGRRKLRHFRSVLRYIKLNICQVNIVIFRIIKKLSHFRAFPELPRTLIKQAIAPKV